MFSPAMTQFADQFRIRLISQLNKDTSIVLQKLLKSLIAQLFPHL